jgi:hypothetical protein
MLEYTPFDELVPLIEDFFGSRVSVQVVDSVEKDIVFVLYDAFAFSAGVDERGAFGVVRLVGDPREYASFFLGRETSKRTGDAQIRGALEAIDEYCRLQLPQKYLDAFDAAVRRAGTVDVYSNPNE